MFIFFFSSRRRHTRWPRDWSSDVCSSGSVRARGRGDHVVVHEVRGPHPEELLAGEHEGPQVQRLLAGRLRHPRSEERRVGKECGARGRTYGQKEERERKRGRGETAKTHEG